MDTKRRVSTESWPWRRKFSSTPAGFWTHDLLIMSLMLQPLSYSCSPILSCDFLSSQLSCVPGPSCSLKGDNCLTIEHILITCSDFIEWERATLQLSHCVCCFRIFNLRRFLTFWKKLIFLEKFKFEIIFSYVCVIHLVSMVLKLYIDPF